MLDPFLISHCMACYVTLLPDFPVAPRTPPCASHTTSPHANTQDELARSVTMEQGKTLPDAKGDVFRGLGKGGGWEGWGQNLEWEVNGRGLVGARQGCRWVKGADVGAGGRVLGLLGGLRQGWGLRNEWRWSGAGILCVTVYTNGGMGTLGPCQCRTPAP